MEIKGSIQEKNGTFYTVISYKNKQGVWKYKWKTTGLSVRGNKKKAEQILVDQIEEFKKTYSTEGSIDGIDEQKILFSDFIMFWLSIRREKLQVTTYDGYLHILKKHIVPYFNERKIKLKDLKVLDIQNYYQNKLENGLSGNSVIKHHAIIRTALQYAVKTRIIRENLADFVDKPQKKETEASYYNLKDLNTLFEACKNESINVPILLAAHYGLRRSEVLGVKWSNISFEEKIIKIHHKVVRTFDEEGRLIISAQDQMKNTSSYRVMPISDSFVKILRRLKIEQMKNKLMFGNSYNNDFLDYVCVNEMGELFKPDYISSKFKNIIKKYNLKPLNFHGLRHSCATLLLNLNYNIKDIQEYLGHADYRTTAKTYAHVDLARKNDMSDGIGRVLNF